MGARAAYTLASGLAIGIGGMFGLVGFLITLIPHAAVTPILIFIGIEITTLSFRMSPRRHAMAVVFAIMPAVLAYGYIMIKQFTNMAVLPGEMTYKFIFLAALGEGYVLTAMVWGAAAAFIIDRRIPQAALALSVGALFSLFGMMHSIYVKSGGGLYLPWALDKKFALGDRALSLPYEFALSYAGAALLLLLIHYFGPSSKGRGPAEIHREDEEVPAGM